MTQQSKSFDARGAAQALKAAIARGDVDVEPLYGTARGGPRIPCPLHGSNSAVFEVYDDGGWRCHSQCSSGDVFNFVATRQMNIAPGTQLRGNNFADAVRRTFEALGVHADAYGCARSPVPPGGKGKPYPPASEVSRLLAFAHELAIDGTPFDIGGRARPAVGTNAAAAGLGLCVELGADLKKHRPKWAARWPAGKLFALYDEGGALATVHLRPDNASKGKGRNPPKFNPSAFLMNAPMRALSRGESKDEANRARLLGYDTARESARSGVLVTEGPPAWCAWSRWHAGPVGGVCGQDPTAAWMRRLPADAPVLLDFDPDLTGLKYLQAALAGLARHEDVRISTRMRWIVDRRVDAKKSPDAVSAALADAQKEHPELRDPDELEGGPSLDWFTPLAPEERVAIVDQGRAFGSKWVEALRTNAEGKIAATEGNLVTAFKTDPRWEGVIGHDERTDFVVFLKAPPVPDIAGGHFPRVFRDEDATHIGAFFEDEVGVAFSFPAINRAVAAYASLHGFDRVREYLERVGAAWDGTPRLDTWLVDCLGAEDTPVNRAFGAKWLISGVARTFEPGCKVDHVLVFEGKQGGGKSTSFANLCPDMEYFTDAMPDLRNDKAAAELITSGVWICELAELDSTAKAESSAVKAFITRREERYRSAYGHWVRPRPRRVIFGATTNDDRYLRDQTGNRRFWPVRVHSPRPELVAELRDQLWAEATVRYRAGEAWHLDNEDLVFEAQQEQEDRRETDPWEVPVKSYLETWRDEARRHESQGGHLRLVELPAMCFDKLDMKVSDTKVSDQRRMNGILTALGWERVQRRDGTDGGRRRAWEPTDRWLSQGLRLVSQGRSGVPCDAKNPMISATSQPSQVSHPRARTRGGESELGGLTQRGEQTLLRENPVTGCDPVTGGESPMIPWEGRHGGPVTGDPASEFQDFEDEVVGGERF